MSVFARALARIPSPSDWCQGHFGKTSGGSKIYYRIADRVCLVGAMLLAGATQVDFNVLRQIAGEYDLAEWNDSHTHADVVALLEAAAHAVAVEARHHESSVL